MNKALSYISITSKVLFFVVIILSLLYLNYSSPATVVEAVNDETPPVDNMPSEDYDTPSIGTPNEVIDDKESPVETKSPEEEGSNPEEEPTESSFENTVTPNNEETPANSPDDNIDNEISPTPSPDDEPKTTPKPDNGQKPVVYEPSQEQIDFNNIVLGGKEKTAYLTFDDGPTPKITAQILEILKKEDVKATFFVIGSSAKSYPSLVKKVYEEGHGIGNHTYTHDFAKIYSSKYKYMNEIKKTERLLKSILGEDKQFMVTRFPGGSFGEKLIPYRNLVNKSGYVYVDWNSLNGDAETVKIREKDELIERLKSTVKGQTNLIVLMHDAPKKTTTVEALPDIIKYLKSLGYKFELLPWTR